MQHFKWTKAHAIFLPEVDAEHRNLYRMAEELQQALRAGADAARVQELVRPLIAAIEEHFGHEERLMRSAACPDYEWHKLQHETLRKRMKRIAKQVEAGEIAGAQEMLDYLSRWFKDHMALTDRMMGAHLRNYGRLHAVAAAS